MKELKFRTFDGTHMMLSDDYTEKHLNDECDIETAKRFALADFFEFHLDTKIMQFTGFTDKKGNEVYEDDLVIAKRHNSYLGNSNQIYRIDYDSNLSQFVLFCIKADNDYYVGKIATKRNNQPYLINNITEVVGNIYQPCELL